MASGFADTPRKAYITASLYATAQGDLKARREELRFTMHNKITCIPYKNFMDEFLPEVQTRQTQQELPKTDASSSKSRLRSRSKPSPPPKVSIPVVKLPQSPFKGMATATTEKDMYTKIVRKLPIL
ncbi:hypothetical protein C8Q78DRAFT_976929 [Trametes maxima]|nr:hypothetical protein C8Q78DRAFT_976929 [Trametes maxima]